MGKTRDRRRDYQWLIHRGWFESADLLAAWIRLSVISRKWWNYGIVEDAYEWNSLMDITQIWTFRDCICEICTLWHFWDLAYWEDVPVYGYALDLRKDSLARPSLIAFSSVLLFRRPPKRTRLIWSSRDLLGPWFSPSRCMYVDPSPSSTPSAVNNTDQIRSRTTVP